MSGEHNDDPDRPKRIASKSFVVSDLYKKIEGYGSELIQGAKYGKESFKVLGDGFGKLPDDPRLDGIENILDAHRYFLEKQGKDIGNILKKMDDTTYTTANTIGVSGYSIASTIVLPPLGGEIRYVFPEVGPPKNWRVDKDEVARKLDKFDPELGRVYRSVWEIYSTTSENPERAAMYHMRQTYDHLLRRLSPDEDVRKSVYYDKNKKPPDDGKVIRRERIAYAAFTNIANSVDANLIVGNTDHILETYSYFNKAHGDKPIDSKEAKIMLDAMDNIIKRWVDLLNL
jgi:hypothetical protein